MQSQREEKQLEGSLDALTQKVQDLKNSIGQFLFKLEHEYETLTWPTVLDNYALLTGHISTLNRLLRNEKCPLFRNHILLPLVLSPDRDPELEKLTEGRVQAFNHEVVPDYLRTKPEPEVEEKLQGLQNKANTAYVGDMQKQVRDLNKISNNIVDMITTNRNEFESELSSKHQIPQMCQLIDTNKLIASTTFGKDLKPRNQREHASHQAASVSQQSAQHGFLHPMYAHMQQGGQQGQQMHQPKAQSTIKTNIKAASGSHPYAR